MSPKCEIGTPTLPTSPRASGSIAVISGLRRQIEGDRKAGLAFIEVRTVQFI